MYKYTCLGIWGIYKYVCSLFFQSSVLLSQYLKTTNTHVYIYSPYSLVVAEFCEYTCTHLFTIGNKYNACIKHKEIDLGEHSTWSMPNAYVLSCMTSRDMTNSWVTWLMHMYDMTHAYVWHDSCICVMWLMHMCDVTHAYVWHDSCICVTWLMHMCDWQDAYSVEETHTIPYFKGHFPSKGPIISGSFMERDLQHKTSYAFLPPCTKFNVTHFYVWHGACMCNKPHTYVRRDWFICVTYLYLEVMHTCNATNSSVTEPMHTCDVTDSVAVHYLLVLNIDIVRGARCIKARRITRGGILRDIHWERESACARMWVRG